MPNLRLTDREAADVTSYLMSLRNEEFESQLVPQPDSCRSGRDHARVPAYSSAGSARAGAAGLHARGGKAYLRW